MVYETNQTSNIQEHDVSWYKKVVNKKRVSV